MQLSRAKFQKSFILSAKKWINCFSGKNPVDLREKSGGITGDGPDGGGQVGAGGTGGVGGGTHVHKARKGVRMAE